jgi:sulfatase modifying factor 1
MVWIGQVAAAALPGVVSIPGGEHRPFYPPSPEQQLIQVAPFRLDATPVTNAEYLAFLGEHPEWQDPPEILAEDRYLQSWTSPGELGQLDPQAPVTDVSWHAARAYCQARGGDLPTVTEWEFAADATTTQASGARKDPATLALILDWYAERGDIGPVRQREPDVHGVYDMHGLVWEWTLDFNSQLISGDAREAGDADRVRFCGAGALDATDPEDYASFMRFAYRSSLTANATTSNLGFRCAYSP